MKFLSMHMPAFGPFTDFELDFGSPGLQVVFGPNESGKSSSLRAFRALLYGMHRQTTDAFLHPYQKLAIRARLEHSDGSVLDLVRRKGRKDTLKSNDGETVEEAQLTRFIGNLTEEVFDRLYGLDHRTLASGGKALLAEGGKVGESLFAANVGPAFRVVREQLRKEADELWRPRGRTQALNATIGDWKDATKQTKEATLQVSKFEALQAELEEQESLAADVREELAATRARLEKLGNQKKALQSWARYKELNLELEELSDCPDLDEDFSRRREEAHDDYKQAMAELTRLKTEHSQLGQKLQSLPKEWPVLDAADAIENLYRRASRVEDLLTEIPVLEAELKHLKEQVQKSRVDLSLAEESDLFPNSSIRAEAGELATEHLELTRRRASLEENLTKLQSRLARLEAQKQELNESAEMPELQLLLQRARNGANWESRLEQLRGEYKAARNALDSGLQSLPFWSGSLDQLKSLSVPSLEAVDQFAQDLQSAQLSLQRARQERDSGVKKLEKNRAELAGMEAEGAVPSPEHLEELREARGRRFEDVIAVWDAGKTPKQSQGELAEFRGAVERADRHSDDIARNADRVARRASLLKLGDELASDLAQLETRLKETQEALDTLGQQWQQLWDSELLTVRPPQEMRRWLEQRKAVLDRQREFELVQKEGTTLDKQRQDALDGLVKALARYFPEVDLPFDNLTQTLEFLDKKLTQANEASGKRATLEQSLTETRYELDEATAKQQQVDQQLAQWQPRWEETLAHFSLHKQPTPQALRATLQDYEELQRLMQAAENAEERLNRLLTEREVFELQARELVTVLPELAEQTPVALAQHLHSRLLQAREESKKRNALQSELEEVEKVRGEARYKLQGAQERVGQLLTEAGAAAIEELPALERKVAQKRHLLQLQHEVGDSLRALSSGATLDEFCSTLASLSAEQLELELEELGQTESELDSKRNRHSQRIGELNQMLQQMDGSDRAAEAAEKAAQLMTEGVDLVAQLMRLELAEHILKIEIERYRQANEGPILKRSSHYFSQLTCGEYTELHSAFQDDSEEPVLEARSKSGRTVTVDGMSEGTRDQLYLSLRLATIEQRGEDAEPFPFIADDLLVHFDRERAMATLRVLAEFGQKNQVLLFTHLDRDRELAEELDSELAEVKCLERLAL